MSSWLRWIPVASAGGVFILVLFKARRVHAQTGTWPVTRGGRANLVLGLFGIGLIMVSSFIPYLHEPAVELIILPALGFLLLAIAAILWIAGLMALGDQWRIGLEPLLPQSLVTSGPYRFVRHPIYTALLCWLVALACLFPNGFFVVVATVGYLMVRRQAIAEEQHLITVHGSAYQQYLAQAGRFLPRIRRLSGKR